MLSQFLVDLNRRALALQRTHMSRMSVDILVRCQDWLCGKSSRWLLLARQGVAVVIACGSGVLLGIGDGRRRGPGRRQLLRGNVIALR
jgi:hypothetical protein